MAVHASAVASPPPTSTPVKTWRRDHRPTRGSRGSARCGRRMPATGGRLKKSDSPHAPKPKKPARDRESDALCAAVVPRFSRARSNAGGFIWFFHEANAPTIFHLRFTNSTGSLRQSARFRKIGPVVPCLPRGPFAADDERAREDSLTWRGDFSPGG